jgi:hypothetical protein
MLWFVFASFVFLVILYSAHCFFSLCSSRPW